MTWLYYRFIHRHLMRLSHYYGWHYAPTKGPVMPNGDMYRWCQWCGLRDTIPNPNRLRAELNAEAYPQSAALGESTKEKT